MDQRLITSVAGEGGVRNVNRPQERSMEEASKLGSKVWSVTLMAKRQ